MKKLIISIITVLAIGQFLSATQLTDRAEDAYKAEDYAQACSLYVEAANKEGVSSDLYYNLGNAHYRCGHIAQAILSYERALRLDPSNSDAKENLDFVNARIIDKKGETGSFIYNAFNSFVNLAGSDVWALIAVTFFCLTIAGAAIYFFMSSVIIRKIGFFGGILTLLLSILAIVFSFRARTLAEDQNDAIITAETAILSTVPRTPSNHEEEAMLLHEGTKVRILRSLSQAADSVAQTWHEVEIDNKHRAWINDRDIEKIMP